MPFSKTILVAAIAAVCLSTAAEAGDWTNSANYNGFGDATQNAPSNFSLRDANGNLTVVNGQFVGSSYSASTGAQSASAYGSGVGMQGGQDPRPARPPPSAIRSMWWWSAITTRRSWTPARSTTAIRRRPPQLNSR